MAEQTITIDRELLNRALRAISAAVFGTDTFKVSSRGDFCSKVEKEIQEALSTPPAAPRLTDEQIPDLAGIYRCPHCDNTGDVHDQTGEWRGTCTECPEGRAVAAQIGDAWLDISSAPKNGNILVVGRWWSDGQGFMNEPHIGRWNPGRERWEFTSGAGPCGIRPTHWQPLPNPPIPSKGQGAGE